jgi:energy-converting hydrogenase B subunit C
LQQLLGGIDLWQMTIEIIQSIFLLIASILIIATAYGILKLDSEMENVWYARIILLGMFDIAGVLALIGLNQILLAGVYFLLAPFIAHAIANAFYHGEDEKQVVINIDEFSNQSLEEIDRFFNIDKEKTNDKIMEDTHD